ncbi:MAG: histone deacetylase [Candidatus Calescibacterium sp.]|nr:histone deacetylase [Candidatus Calescibacterium sp.]MCX7972265.1 histone deacetylase [bacterium]MDW8195133.1 histone deacetylase [Candidatus Calescibacterium sp.]
MIGIAYNEFDYLHNIDSHVENSLRTESIISEIISYKKEIEDRINFFIVKDLNYQNETWSLVYKVHTQEYVDFVKQKVNKIKKFEFLDPDTYITPHTLKIILSNLEILFSLCDWIVSTGNYGFAYIRPPGHHAESKKAMGFCIINNVAVLARYLQTYHNIKKVMIVDFDAHHGNGTQEIFYSDDTVLYFSTHAYPFYPFTGSNSEKGSGKGIGYTYNFPVSIYAGDKELLEIYQKDFVEIYDRFEPEFLIISSGYDIHSHDPITYMNCSLDGINKIKSIILQKAKYKNLVFVLEGGYNINVLKEVVKYDINRIQ